MQGIQTSGAIAGSGLSRYVGDRSRVLIGYQRLRGCGTAHMIKVNVIDDFDRRTNYFEVQ
jgi:hypothetical protein